MAHCMKNSDSVAHAIDLVRVGLNTKLIPIDAIF